MQGYVGKGTWERVHDGHGHLRKVTWVRELGKTHVKGHIGKGLWNRAHRKEHICKRTWAMADGKGHKEKDS